MCKRDDVEVVLANPIRDVVRETEDTELPARASAGTRLADLGVGLNECGCVDAGPQAIALSRQVPPRPVR